jgi:hypothetical protein
MIRSVPTWFLALMMLAAPAFAQSVDPPQVKPGDRWVYHSGEGKRILTVTGVAADGTITGEIDTPSLGGLEIRFTKEWNPLMQPQAFAGHVTYLRYKPAVCIMPPAPWRVGQNWSCQSSYDYDGTPGTVAVNGRIEAMEKVTVPAGSFDALRVRENVGGTETVSWYAPAAGQFVKVDAGANSPYSMELTFYALK